MIFEESVKRKCLKCGKEKLPPAFVGLREACRECWLYLDKEEKQDFILSAQEDSSYYFNKKNWEKYKASKKSLG